MRQLTDVRWWTVFVIVLAIGCLLGQWFSTPSTAQQYAEPLSLLPPPTPDMLQEIAALRQHHGTVLDGSSLQQTTTEQDFDFSTALATYAGVEMLQAPNTEPEIKNHYEATAHQLEMWATEAEYRYENRLAEKLQTAAAALRELK